jgi:uncharacterized protein (TIGR03435 family)
MKLTIAATLLLAIVPFNVVYGQTNTAIAAFEAASVKVAPPATPGVDYRMRGGPGTEDPGQISYPLTTLYQLMLLAYNVSDDQISGPSWIGVTHYSVVAKIPPNTSKDQFRLMLQNLLAERFHLTLHHETKEGAGYELVLAPKGPKMKPSPPEGDDVAATNGFPYRAPGQHFALSIGRGLVRTTNRMTMAELADWLG